MGKVFELYRRAAMGNGDTGTPVPRPVIRLQSVNTLRADSVIGFSVELQNIGNADGYYSISCTGLYMVGEDTTNTGQLTFDPVSGYLQAGDTRLLTLESASFAMAGTKGTATVTIVLKTDNLPDQRWGTKVNWVYPGIGTGD